MNAKTHTRKVTTRLAVSLAAAAVGLLSLTGAGAGHELGHALGFRHEHTRPASADGLSFTLFQADGTPVRAEVTEEQLARANEP